MELISVADASERKDCTRQAVWGAIKRGEIEAQQVGRAFIISVNQKFEDWNPNPKIQKAGRARWERKPDDKPDEPMG